LQAQIELDETLLAGMREALQAQRLTIDALSVRLQLDAPVQSRQLAVENFDFDGEDDPSALRERLRHALNVLAERDEELGGRQRELAQVGAELERQMHEASTRRSEADFLQGQLKVEEQRVLGLRAELEAAEKKAQRQQRQASEQLEKALTSAKNAEEQRAIWEARYTALQAQLEELAAGDARHQASIAELRAEVDTLRSMNEKSEALLARFRRGRRERRLAAGLD
jgi:chromosome segregation ATPase